MSWQLPWRPVAAAEAYLLWLPNWRLPKSSCSKLSGSSAAAEEAEVELTLTAAQREAEVARLLYPLLVAHLRADCARAHAHHHHHHQPPPSVEAGKPRGVPRRRSWSGSSFGAEVEKQRKLAAFATLQRPQEWYPAARLMKRIVAMVGP